MSITKNCTIIFALLKSAKGGNNVLTTPLCCFKAIGTNCVTCVTELTSLPLLLTIPCTDPTHSTNSSGLLR